MAKEVNELEVRCEDCLFAEKRRGQPLQCKQLNEKCILIAECPENITYEEVVASRNSISKIKIGTRKVTEEEKQKRALARANKPADETKVSLVNILISAVKKLTDEVTIENAERLIAFTYKGNKYTLTLAKIKTSQESKRRTPKKQEEDKKRIIDTVLAELQNIVEVDVLNPVKLLMFSQGEDTYTVDLIGKRK